MLNRVPPNSSREKVRWILLNFLVKGRSPPLKSTTSHMEESLVAAAAVAAAAVMIRWADIDSSGSVNMTRRTQCQGLLVSLAQHIIIHTGRSRRTKVGRLGLGVHYRKQECSGEQLQSASCHRDDHVAAARPSGRFWARLKAQSGCLFSSRTCSPSVTFNQVPVTPSNAVLPTSCV
jgi:hypothetical protein